MQLVLQFFTTGTRQVSNTSIAHRHNNRTQHQSVCLVFGRFGWDFGDLDGTLDIWIGGGKFRWDFGASGWISKIWLGIGDLVGNWEIFAGM